MELFYPEVEIIETITEDEDGNPYKKLTLSTTLRKEGDDGKWYKQRFFQERRFDLNAVSSIYAAIDTFHREIYIDIILGKVLEGGKDIHGRRLFEEDENQQSEFYRVKNLLWFL